MIELSNREALSPLSSFLDTARHTTKAIDEQVQTPAKIARVGRYAGKFISEFTKLSPVIRGPLKATKFFKTARSPAFIRKLGKHAKGTIDNAIQKPMKSGQLLVKTSRDVKKVAAACIPPCKLLNKVGILPDIALSWIPIYHAIHPVLSFVSFGIACKCFQKSRAKSAFYQTMISDFEKTGGKTRKIRFLKNVLSDIQKNDPESLQKSLNFPKEIHLAEKIERLRMRLMNPRTQNRAIDESEELIHTIADRCDVLKRLSTIRLGVKATRVAGGIFRGVLGYTTLGIGTLALASTASVGSWLWQKYWMNPPSPQETTILEKIDPQASSFS